MRDRKEPAASQSWISCQIQRNAVIRRIELLQGLCTASYRWPITMGSQPISHVHERDVLATSHHQLADFSMCMREKISCTSVQ